LHQHQESWMSLEQEAQGEPEIQYNVESIWTSTYRFSRLDHRGRGHLACQWARAMPCRPNAFCTKWAQLRKKARALISTGSSESQMPFLVSMVSFGIFKFTQSYQLTNSTTTERAMKLASIQMFTKCSWCVQRSCPKSIQMRKTVKTTRATNTGQLLQLCPIQD